MQRCIGGTKENPCVKSKPCGYCKLCKGCSRCGECEACRHEDVHRKFDVFNAMYVDMPSKGGMRPGAEFLVTLTSSTAALLETLADLSAASAEGGESLKDRLLSEAATLRNCKMVVNPDKGVQRLRMKNAAALIVELAATKGATSAKLRYKADIIKSNFMREEAEVWPKNDEAEYDRPPDAGKDGADDKKEVNANNASQKDGSADDRRQQNRRDDRRVRDHRDDRRRYERQDSRNRGRRTWERGDRRRSRSRRRY
eukprot:gnl/MRDRNA2_/MRDRNA2_105156_c0_seq1.p1 gnl/MRDRNA2_/MRDRNA2_105156_c0~~gnl/MRDRNA2_/MRDRNA2_105156_c0_seq1.p1  ORF type:complete len:255 (+),score=49.66 gnl/MRDRNA2_/MRDRNA2_105156_c0_seq1:84-848(+)